LFCSAQVELAEVVSTGAKVVIKSCSASKELQREVASFQRLGRHPLLVPLLSVFEEGGQLQLVMPHYSKGDMRPWFNAAKVRKRGHLLHYCTVLCFGLDSCWLCCQRQRKIHAALVQCTEEAATVTALSWGHGVFLAW
jgi:serine/threonine protein kinase